MSSNLTRLNDVSGIVMKKINIKQIEIISKSSCEGKDYISCIGCCISKECSTYAEQHTNTPYYQGGQIVATNILKRIKIIKEWKKIHDNG